MIAKLLPVVLLLMGAGAGIGAGIMLKPDPAALSAPANPCGEVPEPARESSHDSHDAGADAEPEYVKLNNQFVIPVVSGQNVESLVVLSLGLEVESGRSEEIYRREPKLRDVLLQVLFDHANMGGFTGRFTDGNNMDILRMALSEAAQSVIGAQVRGVVITDIARQDV